MIIKFLFISFIMFSSCSTLRPVNSSQPSFDIAPVIENVYIESSKLVFVDRPYFVFLEKSEYELLNQQTRDMMSDYLLSQDTIIFTYHDTVKYNIHAKVGRIVNIVLEPGEEIIGDLIISDSVRIIVASTFHMINNVKVFHITLKITDNRILGDLIITTNRRAYNFTIRGSMEYHNSIVRFVYPIRHRSNAEFVNVPADLQNVLIESKQTPENQRLPLFFNYYMRYRNRNLEWIPKIVYDDSQKIYIIFDESILFSNFPIILGKDKELINYEVRGNMAIIPNMHTDFYLQKGRDIINVFKK